MSPIVCHYPQIEQLSSCNLKDFKMSETLQGEVQNTINIYFKFALILIGIKIN